jgi:hypothetical protein
MIGKQFGTEYGPTLQRGDKTACTVSLQAEIDRLGGVPYGWMRIYETLLFAFTLLQPAHRAMLPVSQGDCHQGQMRRQHCTPRPQVGTRT